MGFKQYTDSDNTVRYKINDIADSGLSQDTLTESLQETSLTIDDVLNYINGGSSDQIGEHDLSALDVLNSCKAILERCKSEEGHKKPVFDLAINLKRANLVELKGTIHHIDQRIEVRQVLDRSTKLVENQPSTYSNKSNPIELVKQWTTHNTRIEEINEQLGDILKFYNNMKINVFDSLSGYNNSLDRAPPLSPQSKVFVQMIIEFQGSSDPTKLEDITRHIHKMCQDYPNECKANEQTLGSGSFINYQHSIQAYMFDDLLEDFGENTKNVTISQEIKTMSEKYSDVCRADKSKLGELYGSY